MSQQGDVIVYDSGMRIVVSVAKAYLDHGHADVVLLDLGDGDDRREFRLRVDDVERLVKGLMTAKQRVEELRLRRQEPDPRG